MPEYSWHRSPVWKYRSGNTSMHFKTYFLGQKSKMPNLAEMHFSIHREQSYIRWSQNPKRAPQTRGLWFLKLLFCVAWDKSYLPVTWAPLIYVLGMFYYYNSFFLLQLYTYYYLFIICNYILCYYFPMEKSRKKWQEEEKKEANQCLSFLHFHNKIFKLLFQKTGSLIFQLPASKSVI